MSDSKQDTIVERRKINKGRRIFNEGEQGDVAYIIEMGEVSIVKEIEGTEVELTTLNPGEIFGEIAILDGRERLASAIALQDSSLIVVSPETLEERISKADKFVKTLLSIFMTNLRETHHTYKNPTHNFESHISSVTRHINSLRDLAHLTHLEAFQDEVNPILAQMRDNCVKLHEVSKKYREKAKG